MLRAQAFLVVALAAVIGASLIAQSELVIYKEGTNLYHRPGCPVIKEGAGALAMTRGQADSRGYKPHPQCDPAQQPPSAPRAGARVPPAPITVYIDGTKYYHRKDCSTIAEGRPIEAKPLDVAGKSYWPCPTCKPPVRRKSSEPAVPGTGRRGR